MSSNAPSPGHSSAEEYEDDTNVPDEGRWSPQAQQDADPTLPPMESGVVSSTQGPKNPTPMQKRRRVTRACDECRRKKIKCDGKQPCTHCTVYSYDCTYDQPSNRRRNPAPQYIEAIENRLHRAEALLKTILPEVDLDDPKYGGSGPLHIQVPAGSRPKTQTGGSAGPEGQASVIGRTNGEQDDDSLLESMVQSTGSLDLDDRGYWDFHGHSSGLVFLRRMRQQFGDLMGDGGSNSASTFLVTKPINQIFDSPRSAADSPRDPNIPNVHDLPSKACARDLCENALGDACALMRFVHIPTFYAMLDRIYDIAPDQYGNDENKFLPLAYSVMAVGSLFAKSENNKLDVEGYESATDRGFKFFKASRQMMDITDCRDLPSLQAIIFMIIFLQSTAKLATCYSYIGIAIHSAVRMGLHRSISRNFNPIELQIRKRMFWQIRKMDFYVGAMLGLPIMLNDDDVDQELPDDIDDEYLTMDAVLPVPAGKVPLLAGSNAHTRLTLILKKVVKHIYPLKGLGQVRDKSDASYVVSHARIREIEQDLQGWMESLPMGLRPGGSTSPELSRIQQLLRMAYAHVQMILYRPFLHYVAKSYHSKSVDKRSYACAAACVSVSRNIIHITSEMKRRGLLIGAYWFTMYTTFFAILALVFFILENPDSATSQDILRDALEGREVLASLAKRSMAADRCTVTLTGLFSQLPEKLERGGLYNRKRQAPSPSSLSRDRSTHSAPGLSTLQNETDLKGNNPARATSFPKHLPHLLSWKRASLPYTSTSSSPMTDNYRRSSHGVYTPSNSDQAGLRTPESTNSSIPFTHFQNPQPFGAPPQSQSNPSVPDLSAMMFPSADPFAYPTQPMITLENRQFPKQEPQYTPSNPNLYDSTPLVATESYESLEGQYFGPFPTYMMQNQQGMQSVPGQMDLSGGWGTAQQQHGGTGLTPGGTNMEDEIFGEEWKGGWMDQGAFGP